MVLGWLKAFKMEIIETSHWVKKNIFRQDIELYMVEFALMNSNFQKDKNDPALLNAIARIPQNGKILKVVFKFIGKDRVKLITAYYLD